MLQVNIKHLFAIKTKFCQLINMQLEEINSKQGVAKSSAESIFVISVVEKDRIKWNFIYM